MGVDLIGEIWLFNDSHKKKPIIKEYWGHTNLKGQQRNDSYYIFLIDTDSLELGGKAKAEFKFKFSDDDRFSIELQEGQILELNEGRYKIGEFAIQKIINERLKFKSTL